MPGDFLNPYAMIPAPPRDRDDPFLGDRPGPGHDVILPDHWSGTIPITITAETPLLLLDQGAVPKGQPIPVRTVNGEPVLEWTSVKGALRSVFEAVTNSRFAVFDDKHSQAMAMRQPAAAALDLFPARVDRAPSPTSFGRCTVVTLLEPRNYPACPPGAFPGGPKDDPELAKPDVWVPARGAASQVHGFRHGEEVEAWIRLMVHPARRRRDGRGWAQPAFWHWRAVDVALVGRLPTSPTEDSRGGRSIPTPVTARVRGNLILGGMSFRGKHDERLFVRSVDPASGVDYAAAQFDIAEDVARRWTAVYDSYARAREAGRSPFPDGRHVTDWAKERLMSASQLCFARMALDAGAPTAVEDLFPVMIGRESFSATPREVLGQDHEPAQDEAHLSPADRLFGWARTDPGSSTRARTVDAYRGHVRADRISCEEGASAVERVGAEGLWLSTLNSPKPEQYRFRLHDGDGRPLPSGRARSTADGYAVGRRLGRAAYWPHRGLPEGYWDWTTARPAPRGPKEVGYLPSEVGDRYREYLAPPRTKADVARRIAEWVKPGTAFTTVLRLENVEESALGVLLWLLTVDHFSFTLGGGKPLGFGSVTIRTDLARCTLSRGTRRRESYAAWNPLALSTEPKALRALILPSMRLLPAECVRAVHAMGRGRPELPVHYPRLRDPQSGTAPPVATSYEWFVENEGGRRLSLPAPTSSDPSLPYLDRRP